MKYKGIRLIPGTESELLINVDITNAACKDIDEMESVIYEVFEENFDDDEELYIYIEQISDTEMQVRCDDIDFSIEGIELLKEIYELLSANELLKVSIGIHIDGKEWFKRDDGSEYNEDIAETWEEFLDNLEV